ncbi:MAG TPA: hypothetical protein VKV95_22480 [Terriglobia bacterium]|nr:hypothetical protein [Terriglobia bacterium]
MREARPDRSGGFPFLVCIPLALIFTVSCGPSGQRPAGPAGDYFDATDLFAKGKIARCIQFSEGLATATPPTAYTDRARVLRVVIFTGQVKAFKELSEAYTKGWEKAKASEVRRDFGFQRQNSLEYGGEAALNLQMVANQLDKGGELPQGLTLEAPYPTAEGPTVITQLNRVVEGGGIDSGDQDAAAVDAQRKGIDDTLGEMVGGGRAAARSAMKAGPVKLDNFTFAIYLAKQLQNGASLFDKKHSYNPAKFRALCASATDMTKAAQATLKDKPDKDKEKEVKKLQDEIKASLKTV